MVSRRVYLTYKDEDITKPFIHEMGMKFDVVTNIRSASVEKGIGLVAIAVEGDGAFYPRDVLPGLQQARFESLQETVRKL